MPVITSRTETTYTLHPEGGPYQAVVSGVKLHEGVQTQWGDKDRLQIDFQTELNMRDHVDGSDEDEPMTISMFVNNNLNKGSRLLELVEQLMDPASLKRVLEEAKDGIDIEQLLGGTRCLIQVVHEESNGKTYANIKSVMRVPEDEEPLPF